MIRKNRERRVLREEWHTAEDGEKLLLLKYPLLEETGLVKHCFTTRFGGVSRGMFSSMNLSFTRGDDPEAVRENFRRLASALGVEYGRFVCTGQTHTTNVRRVTAADAGRGLTRERDYQDVDGLITDEPGLVLSAFFADCVPLYFLDPVRRVIGLSHSGWRGTVGRMGAVTVEAMRREYGSRPEDMLCAVGPSICRDCYEIGEDVAREFAAEFGCAARDADRGEREPRGADESHTAAPGSDAGRTLRAEPEHGAGILRPGAPGKYLLDLWRANEIVLTEAGVLPEHIAVTDICTCCNPDALFSHRASRGRRGNLGAFLCLTERVNGEEAPAD